MTRHFVDVQPEDERLDEANPVTAESDWKADASGKTHHAHPSFSSIVNFISRFSLILILCITAFIVTGFIRFSSHVSSVPVDKVETFGGSADGIVVLTGGTDRVKTALKLLQAGKAKRLLISGVHPKTSIEAIHHVSKVDMKLLECCVDLDRNALNTIGNAEQAANWARKNSFKSLVIVTSTYHMPRSLLEMRHIMPDMEILPFRVRYKAIQTESWIHDPTALKTMVSEYLKYLAVSIKNRISSANHQLVLSKVDG